MIDIDDVVLLVEGEPIPGAGNSSNTSHFVRDLIVLMSRVSLGVRQADGKYRPVAPSEVALDDEDVRRISVQHTSAQPESPRGILAVLVGPVYGRSIARQRPGERPTAPPTPGQAARLAKVDLIRLENEARDRLIAARAAVERHDQLLDAGDVTGAAEIRP